MVMGSSTFIVPMAAFWLVVLATCGGESDPTLSTTATSAHGQQLTPEQEACLVEAIGEQVGRGLFSGQRAPYPDELDAIVGCGVSGSNLSPGSELPGFGSLPEASAPAGLNTVSWPHKIQESSALFGRLPSQVAGRAIGARFDPSGPNRFDTTYGENPQTHDHVLWASVQDLSEGDFFPADTTAGQLVALFAQGFDWELLAAGREGDLAWVRFKTSGVTRDVYGMLWGNAVSSVVFTTQASDPEDLTVLIEAMVSAAGE